VVGGAGNRIGGRGDSQRERERFSVCTLMMLMVFDQRPIHLA
jgi:hypothetical protein